LAEGRSSQEQGTKTGSNAETNPPDSRPKFEKSAESEKLRFVGAVYGDPLINVRYQSVSQSKIGGSPESGCAVLRRFEKRVFVKQGTETKTAFRPVDAGRGKK